MILTATGIWISRAAETPHADPITFENIAARSGVDFVLRNSATPARRQIETMVSGVAIFDYNSDGKPDIYFVNGARQPQLDKPDPSYYNRLYRNDGEGRFTDVTLAAGVRGDGFATGVAAGDFDNDGWEDLFIAGVNRNILYRNRGNGTFEDVTERAGLGQPAGVRKPWSVSAGWFDYDNDGRLDLFVVNYCVWDPEKEHACTIGKARTYCHPKYYDGLPNSLYHNNGDGTFTDVSVRSGIAGHIGKGMALSFLDFDADGRLDVFVTNDTTPNFLFRNLGDGKFQEVALESGVAFNNDGRAVSSMGADARDIDNDGREDLFVTANEGETFPLFRNLGGGLFADITNASGVGHQTRSSTGWSTGIFDFNNDGAKDLFAACGSIDDNVEEFSHRSFPSAQSSAGKRGRRKIRRCQRAGGRRLPKGRLESRRCVRRPGWRWARRRGGEPNRRARGDFPEYLRRAQPLPGGASAREAQQPRRYRRDGARHRLFGPSAVESGDYGGRLRLFERPHRVFRNGTGRHCGLG